MIALDTNLLVRLVMNDDKKQTAASLRLLQSEERVVLLNTVLLETVWVLQSVYGASRDDVLKALQRILSIARPETTTVPQALEWFRDGMDIADALHLATATAALQLRPRLRKIGEGKKGLCCSQTDLTECNAKNCTLTRDSDSFHSLRIATTGGTFAAYRAGPHTAS
jgi:predicted nucleic-acid-binding protein